MFIYYLLRVFQVLKQIEIVFIYNRFRVDTYPRNRRDRVDHVELPIPVATVMVFPSI